MKTSSLLKLKGKNIRNEEVLSGSKNLPIKAYVLLPGPNYASAQPFVAKKGSMGGSRWHHFGKLHPPLHSPRGIWSILLPKVAFSKLFSQHDRFLLFPDHSLVLVNELKRREIKYQRIIQNRINLRVIKWFQRQESRPDKNKLKRLETKTPMTDQQQNKRRGQWSSNDFKYKRT